MKKWFTCFVCLSLMLVLVACGNQDEDTTANKYVSMATEVVSLLNKGKNEEVYAKFDATMKSLLSLDQMSQLTTVIEQSGAFEKISKSSVEELNGNNVVVLVAKYSNTNRIYTITFNGQDEIIGLYIR